MAVVSTSPATLLGGGTWSQIAGGRVLVGQTGGDADFDTAEETGGAKTHTLTAAEMPVHTHVQNSHNHTQDQHAHVQNLPTSQTGGQNSSTRDTSTTGSSADALSTAGATATNQAATAVNQNAGSGGAHNNMPPYLVVYIWKRTA